MKGKLVRIAPQWHEYFKELSNGKHLPMSKIINAVFEMDFGNDLNKIVNIPRLKAQLKRKRHFIYK